MQSETIGAIAAALAKAQGAIKPAPMDRDNPFFKSRYATLTSLWESARAALSANGLSVVQTTDFAESGDLVLVTTLMHSSGEWVGSAYPVRAKDNTPQALGSALTYARRYAFGALVGLTSDDDDDGNTANGAQQPAHRTPAQNVPPPAPQNGNGRKPATPTPDAFDNVQRARWDSAAAAYTWAVESGACANEHEARGSLKKIVDAKFGGRLTGDNMAAAFDAFHARQMEKLHDKADAAAQDAPELEGGEAVPA